MHYIIAWPDEVIACHSPHLPLHPSSALPKHRSTRTCTSSLDCGTLTYMQLTVNVRSQATTAPSGRAPSPATRSEPTAPLPDDRREGSGSMQPSSSTQAAAERARSADVTDPDAVTGEYLGRAEYDPEQSGRKRRGSYYS